MVKPHTTNIILIDDLNAIELIDPPELKKLSHWSSSQCIDDFSRNIRRPHIETKTQLSLNPRFNTSRSTKSIVSRLNKERGILWLDFFQTTESDVTVKPRPTQDLKKIRSSLSSMDSDLEAFSHNPTDDSFSPLIFQSSENTNYLNQRFLSYWVELLLWGLLFTTPIKELWHAHLQTTYDIPDFFHQ